MHMCVAHTCTHAQRYSPCRAGPKSGPSSLHVHHHRYVCTIKLTCMYTQSNLHACTHNQTYMHVHTIKLTCMYTQSNSPSGARTNAGPGPSITHVHYAGPGPSTTHVHYHRYARTIKLTVIHAHMHKDTRCVKQDQNHGQVLHMYIITGIKTHCLEQEQMQGQAAAGAVVCTSWTEGSPIASQQTKNLDFPLSQKQGSWC